MVLRSAMDSIAEFLMGSLACCSACVFTNPLDVVKTRMQLQGELRLRGTYTIHYRNVFHAFYTIARVDGLAALQRGLVPGLVYNGVLNGIRLGSYQCVANYGLLTNDAQETVFWRCVLNGAICGCLGAFAASPAHMFKTQLQSKSTERIAVGTQHNITSFSSAVRTVYTESGILGLWRGVSGGMIRVSVGSAAQLSTFTAVKDIIDRKNIFTKDSITLGVVSSFFSGIVACLVMHPFDVISTRLYNQGLDRHGIGQFYSGPLDCITKILRQEGILGLYKGIGAQYFRIGPHTMLCMVFWNEFRKMYNRTKINAEKARVVVDM